MDQYADLPNALDEVLCTEFILRHSDNKQQLLQVSSTPSRILSPHSPGGQIKDDDSSEDIKTVDLSQVHYLSGPIRVTDQQDQPALPGDILVVEICNLGALTGDEWGFTGTFDRDNGGGFLTDHFPEATKAIWHFDGIYAYSRHIPGVRFPGLIHPGRWPPLTALGTVGRKENVK
jgi:hypothetical protein